MKGASRDWTKLRRVFHDADYSHDVASLAVSDNGALYVGATAKPHVATSPPTYRAQVATKWPGDPWKTMFLSPPDDFAVLRNVVANAKGQAVAAFVLGYELADMRVRAATRGAGAKSKWKLADLSAAGESQRAHAAIGPDRPLRWSGARRRPATPRSGSRPTRSAREAPGSSRTR